MVSTCEHVLLEGHEDDSFGPGCLLAKVGFWREEVRGPIHSLGATLSLPPRRWMFALGCAWEAGGGGLTVPDLHMLCNCKNVAGCKALHTREPRRQCQPGGPNHPLSVTISGSRPVGLFLARSDCSHTKLPFSPSPSRYRHGVLCHYPHDPSIVGILSDGAGPVPSCHSHAEVCRGWKRSLSVRSATRSHCLPCVDGPRCADELRKKNDVFYAGNSFISGNDSRRSSLAPVRDSLGYR